MTLAAQIVTDAQTLCVNTNDFGELVTYSFGAGGPSLTFAAVVDPRVDEEHTEYSKRDVELIDVTLPMDPAGVLGLPGLPRHGDYLWRSGAGDDPDRRYAFEGQIGAAVGGMIEATFRRTVLRQVGLTK